MIATSDQSRSSTTISFADSDALVIHSNFIPTDKMKFSYNVVVVSNSRRLDESGDLTGDALHRQRVSPSTQITPEFRLIRFSQKWGKWESPSSSENGNHLRRRQTLSPKIIADRAASCSSQLCTGLDLAPQTRLYLREYLKTK